MGAWRTPRNPNTVAAIYNIEPMHDMNDAGPFDGGYGVFVFGRGAV